MDKVSLTCKPHVLTIDEKLCFSLIYVAHMLLINKELKKFLILDINPNKLHHRGLNSIFLFSFLSQGLSSDDPITTGTNNPIRPNWNKTENIT